MYRIDRLDVELFSDTYDETLHMSSLDMSLILMSLMVEVELVT